MHRDSRKYYAVVAVFLLLGLAGAAVSLSRMIHDPALASRIVYVFQAVACVVGTLMAGLMAIVIAQGYPNPPKSFYDGPVVVAFAGMVCLSGLCLIIGLTLAISANPTAPLPAGNYRIAVEEAGRIGVLWQDRMNWVPRAACAEEETVINETNGYTLLQQQGHRTDTLRMLEYYGDTAESRPSVIRTYSYVT